MLCFCQVSSIYCVCQSRENSALLKVLDNPLVTSFYRPVESVIALLFRESVGGNKGRPVKGVSELATLFPSAVQIT
jgi:hypothetical protein